MISRCIISREHPKITLSDSFHPAIVLYPPQKKKPSEDVVLGHSGLWNVHRANSYVLYNSHSLSVSQ